MKAFGKITQLALSIILMAGFTTSCVHQWPDPAETDFILHLSFPGEMPQGPVYDLETRASNSPEDYDVRYVIEAYEKSKDGSYKENQAYARFEFTRDEVRDLDNTFTLNLMEGEYRFRAWVDYIDAATGEERFHNADDFRYIKLFGRDEKIAHTGNNDFRDAFTGYVDVDVIRYGSNHAPTSATMEMYRPVSKVVFITTDLNDWITKVITNHKEMMAQSGLPTGEITKDMINLKDYTVKIHYPQYMPNAFNLVTDRTAWSDVNVSFTSQLIKLNDAEASMGFDYVFANSVDPKVVMAVSLHSKDGTQLARSIDITVPLERGKVTTVKGSFLLEESDGGVSINPDFDGEFNIVL